MSLMAANNSTISETRADWSNAPPLSAVPLQHYISRRIRTSIVASRPPGIDVYAMRVMHLFQVAILDVVGLALCRVPAVALGRDFLEGAADPLHMVDKFVQQYGARKLVVCKIEGFIDVDAIARVIERLGGAGPVAKALLDFREGRLVDFRHVLRRRVARQGMDGGQQLQSQRRERKRVHICVALGPAFLPTPPGRLMTFYLPVYQVTDLSSEI